MLTKEVAEMGAQQDNITGDEALKRFFNVGRRVRDEQVAEAAAHPRATPYLKRLAIDFAELEDRKQKREQVIARKQRLVARLERLFTATAPGVMKDEMDADFYNELKTRKGALTEEMRVARRWLLLDDVEVAAPAPAAPAPAPAVAAAAAAAPPAVAAGAAAYAAPPPLGSERAKAVRITANGEADRRFTGGK